MCQQNHEASETKKCKMQGDVRTFCIALLTAVIVLAIYHFGMGICAILTGTSSCTSMPVTRDYVLVPVSAMPQKAPGFGGEGRRFRGEFPGGPRGEFRRGPRGEFPGGPRGEFRRGPRGEFRGGPQQGGAPANPAPAPAAQPAQ